MTKKAPNFTLLDQDGKPHSLADYKGRWLVVYFYPSDKSLNCTREACYFRDAQKVISQFGNATTVGVNHGPIEKHKKFAMRNRLNFPILSDPGHKITEAFGAWRKGGVKWYDRPYGTRRNTYLVSPQGRIVKEYIGITPRGHVETIIQDLQRLQEL